MQATTDAPTGAAPAVIEATTPGPRHARADDEIRYSIDASTLGLLLVARSAAGVCAVLIDDDADALIRDLQARFPRAALRVEHGRADPVVAQVRTFIDAAAPACDVALDLRGTAFQREVWAALRQVPPGETTSYAEIARRVGRPDAVRAVGQAVAANPIAVIVPCHRAIRSDGSLSGYRWGVARKRALLDRERAARGTPARPAS